MRTLWKNEEHLYPTLALLAAAAVLLPFLGGYGLWDPQEIVIADTARQAAAKGNLGGIYATRPPLTIWLIATSVEIFGTSEWSARLPLALLGVVAVVGTYFLGARLRGPRAGALAALVLVTAPLLVFQARQLTSEIATVAAATIALLGLTGLAWPEGGRLRGGRAATDAALALVGLAAGFLSAGLLIGVFVPLAALALASAFAAAGRFHAPVAAAAPSAESVADRVHPYREDATADEAGASAPPPSRAPLVAAAVTGALALVTLGVVLATIYDVVPAQPGKLGLFGKTLAVTKGYLPLLGGVWRTGTPPASAAVDTLVEQVAFGMFPWAALAPLALLLLAAPRGRDRVAWAGLVVLLWATVAYVVGTIWVRKVAELRYPALPAIALGVGFFLDDFLPGRLGERDDRRTGLPLVAFFVLCAGLQLARDAFNFPDRLAFVHVLATLKYPVEVKLLPFVLAFGLLFTLAAAAGLYVPPTPRPEAVAGWRQRRLLAWLVPVVELVERARGKLRYGLVAALGLSLVFALFLAHVFTPSLSQHFSYKNLFDTFHEHRTGKEPLAVMGIPGSGPEYYAGGAFERLGGRAELERFLARPERVFAIVPAGELCPINQAKGAGTLNYHVLDNRNSRFLLLTNQLAPGEKDQNPLLQAIRREPPAKVDIPIGAIFDNKLELIGIDMPKQVGQGDKFAATLHFRVLERMTTAYKVFMHFDGMGVRFLGDHEPIQGRCGTNYWQKGDYIADRVIITAGEVTHPRGTYTLRVGLFTGGMGSYKNMPVTKGNADAHNRVLVGPIRVR